MTLKDLRQIVEVTANLPEETLFNLEIPDEEDVDIEYNIKFYYMTTEYHRDSEGDITPHIITAHITLEG